MLFRHRRKRECMGCGVCVGGEGLPPHVGDGGPIIHNIICMYI